ncbi:MAG: hypothetical protein U1E53_20135 [Dongiaceae bacterium]
MPSSSAAQPLLGRIRMPIERALRDALHPDTVAKVVLAGGASRADVPPADRPAVPAAAGAARRSRRGGRPRRRGAGGLVGRDAALGELVMTDVAPFSLGVEVAHESRMAG